MGVYDRVVIDEPKLREALGKYSGLEFQTKYNLVHGYLRVYTVEKYYEPKFIDGEFDEFTETIYIDLYLEPKPSVLSRVPCLGTVKLSELGVVKKIVVGVWVCVLVKDRNFADGDYVRMFLADNMVLSRNDGMICVAKWKILDLTDNIGQYLDNILNEVEKAVEGELNNEA